MSQFLTPLIVEKVGPQLWKLHEPLVFLSDLYPGQFVAPKGMVTNFASIPRVFWVRFPPVDIYDPAAVIHDGAYQNSLLTREGQRINVVKFVADNLFKEALLTCGVGKIRATQMYEMVKLFGRHPLVVGLPVDNRTA